MGGEDEDFGCGDWIKPFFNPSPDRWEKGRCSDDLEVSSFSSTFPFHEITLQIKAFGGNDLQISDLAFPGSELSLRY